MENETVAESLDAYLSKKDYISISELRQFRISPKHYEYYKKSAEMQDSEKRLLIIDEAINCCLRDGDLFYEKYIGASVPKYKSKKDNAELIKETQSLFSTKTVIEKSIFDMIVESCKGIRRNENIKRIFGDGMDGVSIYKIDQRTGLKIKARLSWFSHVSEAIFDCKIYDTSYRQFINNYFSTGLYLEVVWSSILFERYPTIISIEGYPPFISNRVEVFSEDLKDKSHSEIKMLLDLLYVYKKTGYSFDVLQFEEIKEKVYSADYSLETLLEKINEFINKKDAEGNPNGLNKGFSYLQKPVWLK